MLKSPKLNRCYDVTAPSRAACSAPRPRRAPCRTARIWPPAPRSPAAAAPCITAAAGALPPPAPACPPPTGPAAPLLPGPPHKLRPRIHTCCVD